MVHCSALKNTYHLAAFYICTNPSSVHALEYCCHIWAGASLQSLSLLDRIQRRIENLIGPTLASELLPLSHRRDVASLALFYKYFSGRCSSELSSLVPPTKVFNRSTRLSRSSHPFTVDLPHCVKRFYSRSFFPRTASIWNSLPLSCFPPAYNLALFKSLVNSFLSKCKPPPSFCNPLSRSGCVVSLTGGDLLQKKEEPTSLPDHKKQPKSKVEARDIEGNLHAICTTVVEIMC